MGHNIFEDVYQIVSMERTRSAIELGIYHSWWYPAPIARFMGPTWGPPGSCRPQVGPMLDPWTLLSGPAPCWDRQTTGMVLRTHGPVPSTGKDVRLPAPSQYRGRMETQTYSWFSQNNSAYKVLNFKCPTRTWPHQPRLMSHISSGNYQFQLQYIPWNMRTILSCFVLLGNIKS